MKVIFDTDNRGAAYSYEYGYELPPEIEAAGYPVEHIMLSITIGEEVLGSPVIYSVVYDPPPAAGEHEIAVFDPETQTWSLEPDWRGVPLYLEATGALTAITEVGVEPADISAVETAPTGPAGATAWTWDAENEEWDETLASAKLRGTAAVNAAYPVAADAWVPDGDPGTYSYSTTEIISLQAARTGTGNVTVTQKTIADETTAPVSVNDAAFKVIAASIADFLDTLITEYDGYLSDIAAASTVADVDLVLENL